MLCWWFNAHQKAEELGLVKPPSHFYWDCTEKISGRKPGMKMKRRLAGSSIASFFVVTESTCIYFTDRSPHRNGRHTVEISDKLSHYLVHCCLGFHTSWCLADRLSRQHLLALVCDWEREKKQQTIMNVNRDQVLTSCPDLCPVTLHVRIERLKYFSNIFSSKQYSELWPGYIVHVHLAMPVE